MEHYYNDFNLIREIDFKEFIEGDYPKLNVCISPYPNIEKPSSFEVRLSQMCFKKVSQPMSIPPEHYPKWIGDNEEDGEWRIVPTYRRANRDIYNLGLSILRGHSFLACYTETGSFNHDWICSNMIGIDIDNGLTIDDALKRCEEFGLYPTIIYPTFSHLEKEDDNGNKIEKFRMLFVVDETINEVGMQKLLIDMVMRMFPECDVACKNICRLWHGTNKGWMIIHGKLDNLYKSCISPQKIVQSFYLWVKRNKGDSNRARFMKDFCRTHHVKYTGKSPYIDLNPDGRSIKVHWSDEEKAHSVTSIKTKVNKEGKQSTEYEKSQTLVKQKLVKESKKRDVNFDEVANKCYLFGAARTGEYWLYEPELVHLIRNLQCCTNGKEELKKIILEHPRFYDNQVHGIDFYLDKIDSIEIRLDGVTTCKNNCPFWQSEKCHCIGKTILDNVDKNVPSVDRISIVKKVSLEESQMRFKEAFHNAISSNKVGVHIIKSSMGMGKTEEVASIGEWIDTLGKIDVVSNEESKKTMVVIAEPTHIMKGEIGSRMVMKLQSCLEMAVVEVKPKPKLQDICDEPDVLVEYEAYERMGAFELCSRIHNEWIDKMAVVGNLECINYRENQQLVATGEVNALLTTHDKVILTKEFDDADIIIFDEDPTQRLIKTQTTSIEDIERLKNCLLFIKAGFEEQLDKEVSWCLGAEQEEEKINHIKQVWGERVAQYECTIEHLSHVIIKIRSTMQELVACGKQMIDIPLKLQTPMTIDVSRFMSLKKTVTPLPKTNVIDFVNCNNYVVYADGKINYITRRYLRPDKKYLVLSGTADEKVCNHIFDGMLASFVDCGIVENQGTVYQNIEKSCNKNFLHKNIEEIVNGVFDLNPELSRERAVAITHKQFSNRVEQANTYLDSYGNKIAEVEQVNTFCGMWYGATEGKNDFYSTVIENGFVRERRQGEPPYFNTLLLLGKYVYPMEIFKMWCSVLGIEDDTMQTANHIPVTRYGITNYMTTFVNEKCREVHLWLIESELRQALGRARQIRPEQKSVNVFVFNDIVLPETDVVVYGDMSIRGECKFDLALSVA